MVGWWLDESLKQRDFSVELSSVFSRQGNFHPEWGGKEKKVSSSSNENRSSLKSKFSLEPRSNHLFHSCHKHECITQNSDMISFKSLNIFIFHATIPLKWIDINETNQRYPSSQVISGCFIFARLTRDKRIVANVGKYWNRTATTDHTNNSSIETSEYFCTWAAKHPPNNR